MQAFESRQVHWHLRHLCLSHSQHILPDRNDFLRKRQKLQELIPALDLVIYSAIDRLQHILKGGFIGSQLRGILANQALGKTAENAGISLLDKTNSQRTGNARIALDNVAIIQNNLLSLWQGGNRSCLQEIELAIGEGKLHIHKGSKKLTYLTSQSL